jgi:hypothetical protein
MFTDSVRRMNYNLNISRAIAASSMKRSRRTGRLGRRDRGRFGGVRNVARTASITLSDR